MMRAHPVFLAAMLLCACSSRQTRSAFEDPLPPLPTASPSASAGGQDNVAPDPAEGVVRGMFPESLDPEEARIGYLPEKRAFLFATGEIGPQQTFGLTLSLVGADGKPVFVEAICRLGQCDEPALRPALAELVRERGLQGALLLDPVILPLGTKQPPLVTVGALGGDVIAHRTELELVQQAGRTKLPLPKPPEGFSFRTVAVAAAPDGLLLAALLEPWQGPPNGQPPALTPAVFDLKR